MKIIKNDNENLIVINKSKFIGIVKKVFNQDEVDNYLNETKNKYPDATQKNRDKNNNSNYDGSS